MIRSKSNGVPEDFDEVAISIGIDELEVIAPQLNETQKKLMKQAVEAASSGDKSKARNLLFDLIKTVKDETVKGSIEYVANCYFENE